MIPIISPSRKANHHTFDRIPHNNSQKYVNDYLLNNKPINYSKNIKSYILNSDSFPQITSRCSNFNKDNKINLKLKRIKGTNEPIVTSQENIASIKANQAFQKKKIIDNSRLYTFNLIINNSVSSDDEKIKIKYLNSNLNRVLTFDPIAIFSKRGLENSMKIFRLINQLSS